MSLDWKKYAKLRIFWSVHDETKLITVLKRDNNEVIYRNYASYFWDIRQDDYDENHDE